jgi:hypothetical protein
VKRIRIVAAVVCLTALVAGTPAAANHGDARKFEAWVASADVGADGGPNGFECRMSFSVGAIERGKHGVERFKYRPRIYLGDTGYAPEWINSWGVGIFFDGGWTYTQPFPDDASHYQHKFSRNWRFGMGNSAYTLVVRAVGVRPSWWRPDLKQDLKVGVCSYQSVNLGS